MKCNIDAIGRRVRMMWGIALFLASTIVLVIASAGWIGGVWVWIVVVALDVLGLLAFWESQAGYCVIRGMGFKTPV